MEFGSRCCRLTASLSVLPDRDVALNGPLLAQIGRDGKTYSGRERSGMLEGCEIIYSGDKRLHSRGHKKPAAKKVEAAEDADEGLVNAEIKPKPKAARKKKADATEDAGEDPVAGQMRKQKKGPARTKKGDAAQAAIKAEPGGESEQAPKPKAAARRKKAAAPKAGAADAEPGAKLKQAASRVKKEQAAIEQ